MLEIYYFLNLEVKRCFELTDNTIYLALEYIQVYLSEKYNLEVSTKQEEI